MPTPCPPHLNGGASDLTASVRSVTWSSSDTEQQLASMAARDAGVPTEDQADRTHQINDAFRSIIAILDMYPSSTWSGRARDPGQRQSCRQPAPAGVHRQGRRV